MATSIKDTSGNIWYKTKDNGENSWYSNKLSSNGWNVYVSDSQILSMVDDEYSKQLIINSKSSDGSPTNITMFISDLFGLADNTGIGKFLNQLGFGITFLVSILLILFGIWLILLIFKRGKKMYKYLKK